MFLHLICFFLQEENANDQKEICKSPGPSYFVEETEFVEIKPEIDCYEEYVRKLKIFCL